MKSAWVTVVASITASAMLAEADAQTPQPPARVVHADVVALDQLLVYNRFGSFNPFGMMFALRRDVSQASSDPARQRPDADECRALTGVEAGEGPLDPGKVMLKRCKRPRPLTLRANVGDVLQLTVTNLLRPDQPDISAGDHKTECSLGPSSITGSYPPRRFCQEPKRGKNEHQSCTLNGATPIRRDIRTHFDEGCSQAAEDAKDTDPKEAIEEKLDGKGDWPKTRFLSLAIPGLEPLAVDGKVHGACLGTDAVAPGETFT